jgi:Terminase RNaseH-like domain/Terminase large subunit, T4likevirus-type, N-terminal
MRRIGLEPDPWQLEALQSEQPQILLNCCRQAGKSTVVAILGLVEAMFRPMTRVILVSRSHRQSRELLKLMAFFFDLLRQPLRKRVNAQEIELNNLSRIVSVPCRADTIRGFAQVDLLVIDEAAQVPDELYRTVRPMLAVSKGRLICLSTPYGKRGFFWDAWANDGEDWARIEIPASKCPRIEPAFLEKEKRALGESWFRQEYCCSFEALEGLVYPDFARCVVGGDDPAAHAARLAKPTTGGIDFGYRNPFAAVWGFVDRDGILWLTGEHYRRQKPLSYHAEKLPREVMWYADPAGASEIAELRCAGFMVRQAKNAKRIGIAAVSARLQNGTLRVLQGCCPNLLAEAGLYRFGDGEMPVDEHNHALDALRYLISRLDAGHLAGAKSVSAGSKPEAPKPDERIWAEPDGSGFWIAMN